jgi:hypothetical protein
MDPIIVAIIIIVFVAIIIISIVLFVVVNKQTHKLKHKPIPSIILENVAKINDVQVIPGPLDRSEFSKSEKKGGGVLGDIYVNKLYDEFVDFCVAQMRVDLNDKRAETVHKKELIRGDNYAKKYKDDAYYTNKYYNNVLNYLIRTEYSEDTPDPLVRLVDPIEKSGIYVSGSPLDDDVDRYNYDFNGYSEITPPCLYIIYTKLYERGYSIEDNSNIY